MDEDRYIRENSVERIMNTAKRLIEKYVPDSEEDLFVSLEDIEDAKPIMTRLWNAERDRIFHKK